MNRTYLTVLSAARNGRVLEVQSNPLHIAVMIEDSNGDRKSIIINPEDWDFFLDRLNTLVGKFNES